MRVAVIGTGISGIACAYHLRGRVELVLYEKRSRPGGHTHTVVVDEDGHPIAVDTGFMVYNRVTYPGLCRFFSELGIEEMPTSMSFSVQHVPSGLEYSGTGLDGLFAQRLNLLSLRHWRLLTAIDRFNKACPETLEEPRWQRATVAEYARYRKLSADLLERYLLPMSSAIWSAESGRMLDFPVRTLVEFYRNHGLLGGLSGHHQWYTVKGGSRRYRDAALERIGAPLRLGRGAVKVSRLREGGVSVRDAAGDEAVYDRVVLACHADEALELLSEPSPEERVCLGAFRYQRNTACLHTDASVMPRSRRAWASWNYRIENPSPDGRERATTVYWMNSLQRVSERRDYFVSINDRGGVDPARVLWRSEYEHPIYDPAAVSLQASRLPALNMGGPVHYCGSYFGYGFHEDGYRSGVRAAEAVLTESAAA
ncbi:MAG: hypothetical protein MOGMAGMI_01710 [Candidatus Omnitrophica bacterium]|nr:hypothetical protein [Candidatus Omnitrophota bacterium]